MAERPHSLVIGGTKGLGRAVASRLHMLGHAVSVVSRHAVPPTPNDGPRSWCADLADAEGMKRVLRQAVAEQGPLSYAVFTQRYRGSGDDWSGEISVSLTGTKETMEVIADLFVSSGDRAIVLVSSVYAEFVGDSQPVSYHVAKAGLNQMVRYYAVNFGKRGIRVNGIMPFTFIKEETKSYYYANKPLQKLLEDIIPLGRMGTTDDSVNVIEFLCSEKASFINGQNICIDGGLSVAWSENIVRRMANL